MKILFLGTSDFGIPTLKAIAAESRHEPVVVTKPDSRAGRGRRLVASPIKQAALDLELEVLQPADVNGPEGQAIASEFAPKVMLVVSYAVKISEAFLDLAPHRGINIHPSLLPRYRGAAPIPNTILNGDTHGGVSIIRVAPRMDSGDILGQLRVAVGERETAGELAQRLSEAAAGLTLAVLDRLEKGTVEAVVQDESQVVKAFRLKKDDGLIDWNVPAESVDRLVRAMSPWPKAYTFLGTSPSPSPGRGQGALRLNVLETTPRVAAAPLDRPPGTILDRGGPFVVACGQGELEIVKVQRQGKNPVTGAEFLRGLRIDPSQEPRLVSDGGSA